MTSKICEPLKHAWEYRWDGVIRVCKRKRCKTMHYYHFCFRQWEATPNASYSDKGLAARDEYEKTHALWSQRLDRVEDQRVHPPNPE